MEGFEHKTIFEVGDPMKIGTNPPTTEKMVLCSNQLIDLLVFELENFEHFLVFALLSGSFDLHRFG